MIHLPVPTYSAPASSHAVSVDVGTNHFVLTGRIDEGSRTLRPRRRIFGLLAKALAVSIMLCTFSAPVTAEDTDIPDPLEGFNRGMFWFNDTLDVYFMEPVAEGYDFITPQPVQNSVKNFFQNLQYPVELVSDVLQLKFEQAGHHTGRFAINSTLGVLGLFDVASEFGLERHQEDLGSAFGNWGIGPGFYLVLPVLGPSSLRDGVGLIGESFLMPTVAVTYSDMPQRNKNLILGVSNSLLVINTRASLLSTVSSAKEASLDYYSFVKHAYQQNRESVINDGPSDDELFGDDEFDDEFDDFEEDESSDEAATGAAPREEIPELEAPSTKEPYVNFPDNAPERDPGASDFR